MIRIVPFMVLLLCGGGSTLRAQEVLTTAYFPVAGDTLRVADADSASRAQIDFQLAGGQDLDWDFGRPNTLFSFDQPVNDVTGDARFPDAQISIAINDDATEFYRSNGSELELVGLITSFDLVPGFDFETPVTPSRVTRRTNLQFGEVFTDTTQNEIVLSVDSLPQAARDQLGGALLNGIDSIRLTSISHRTDRVDAFGTVRLFDNFYSVIREKRTEVIEVRLAVRQRLTPWADVTSTALLFNADLQEFLGPQDPFDIYYYWNNDSKEAIVASRHVPATGESRQMTFKRAQTSTSTRDSQFARADVRLFPNPASDLVTLEVEGLRPGRYFLSLISMTGRQVARREFTPLGDQTQLSVDISGLANGLYLYSLRDDLGRIITTKKLLVRR